MIIWYVLTALTGLLAIAIPVILKILKLTKLRFYHDYITPILLEIKKESSLPGQTTIYASDRMNANYIKKYLVNRDSSDNILICNYARPFKTLSYFVFAYNKKHKLKDVLEIKETNTSTTSKVIGLPATCTDVNIVIKEADGISLNSEIIKPFKNRQILLASSLYALETFLILFVLRQLILYIGFYKYSYSFLNNSPLNLITFSVIFLISLINFAVIYRSLRKRNKKVRVGGVLEYEYF